MYKLNKLREILAEMGSALVAYSGGVDSSLLARVSKDALGDKVTAVTAVSETYSKQELVQAKKTARDLGIRHMVIKTHEFNLPGFKHNPVNRCYYCKKELFSRLKDIAKKKKLRYILDGTNSDDDKDLRPGRLAKEEFGVRSPLREAGFTKDVSRKLGLPNWDMPALACLASRIPYGAAITKEALSRVDKAERFIRSLGFKQVRVRHYENLARIEIGKIEIPRLINRYSLIVIRYLKKIGYHYVTLDLEGYRTGSMNEILRERPNLSDDLA